MPASSIEVVKQIKQRFPGYSFYDLHNHSWDTLVSLSDGWASTGTVLKEAVEHQVDFIAITNHDTLLGAQKAQDLINQYKLPIKTTLASEISTLEGHLLGYQMKQAIPPGLPVRDVLRLLHQQDAFGIAAHPDDPRTQSISMDLVKQINAIQDQAIFFDGVELANATTHPLQTEHTILTYLENPELYRAAVGGSDRHFNQGSRAGTWIKTNQDFSDAIRKRQTLPIITGIPDKRSLMSVMRFGLICAYWGTILEPSRNLKARRKILARLASAT